MTNLSFRSLQGKYIATLTTTGDPMVLQVNRVSEGGLRFSAKIGTLPSVGIKSFEGHDAVSNVILPANVIRVINMPASVTITIESDVNVISAGYE